MKNLIFLVIIFILALTTMSAQAQEDKCINPPSSRFNMCAVTTYEYYSHIPMYTTEDGEDVAAIMNVFTMTHPHLKVTDYTVLKAGIIVDHEPRK